MRLTQLIHREEGRQVALVEDGALRVINHFHSIYAIACEAIRRGATIPEVVNASLSKDVIDYDAVERGESEWKLLPSFDHPEEPARCHVAGTGLTHKVSALNRAAMHAKDAGKDKPAVTDSMKMFEWGLEGGRPEAGKIGVQPEWFYKGTGLILRAHGQTLDVPAYADDGGDEPEVAGCYVIGEDGQAYRVGMTQGNEFADHLMERKNYLYLAPSKLRQCAIGPELVVDADFHDVHGQAAVHRGAHGTIWQHDIATGEANMSHSLANLEYHQFKYAANRRPGDVHVHFFGADAFSFGNGVKLEEGDVMEISFPGFGRALTNAIHLEGGEAGFVSVKALG